MVIAIVLNKFIDWLRNKCWFSEEEWTIPVLIAISLALGLVLYWLIGGEPPLKGIINGFGIVANSVGNVAGSAVSGLNIFGAVKQENKYGATAFVRG